jgi:hypothetical protein
MTNKQIHSSPLRAATHTIPMLISTYPFNSTIHRHHIDSPSQPAVCDPHVTRSSPSVTDTVADTHLTWPPCP